MKKPKESFKDTMDQIQEFLNQFFGYVQDTVLLQQFLKGVAVVAGTWIAWMIVKRIIGSLEKKIYRYSFKLIDAPMVQILRVFLKYTLLLFCGSFLIRTFDITLLEKPFYALIIILMSLPAKDLALWLLTRLEKNVAAKTETKMDDILFELLNKFAGIIILVTAVVLALDMLGINVMPFIAGAGVAGIAIGFAAKDTLSNLIAGVLLIIDRPFEVGDRIEVWSAPKGNATWGDVIDIGIRATRIKTTDNLVIVIPNNEIMKRDIVNYTVLSEQIRVRINIGVSYDTNIDLAKQAIIGVAAKADWVLMEPAPKVVVRNFGESSVDLQLRVWIKDARRRMDTISFVTDNVKAAFDDVGIEIPYPKRDIKIINQTGSAL